VGAAWANSRAAVPLQLEDHIGCRRDDRLELLLPDLRKGGGQGRDDSLPDAPPPIHQNTATGCMGPAAGAPQSTGRRVLGFGERPNRHRIPSALCAGTQSRGISVGSLEAPYTAQRMSQGLMATQRRRAKNLASTSPQTASHYRLLETVFLADRLSYIMRISVSGIAALVPVAPRLVWALLWLGGGTTGWYPGSGTPLAPTPRG